MSATSPTQCELIVTSAVTWAVGLPLEHFAVAAKSNANVPEADLVDHRLRLAATRWPDKETVNNQSQGVKLAKIPGGHSLHPRPLASPNAMPPMR